MATRYRSSIDIGAFLGTRHLTINVDGKDITGIFIPTAINGIEVREDTRTKNQNPSKIRAFVNFTQRSYSSAFLSATKDRLVSRGDTPTPYNVPAWQQCYTLAEDKRNAIRAALKKRVLAEHPEWNGMEDVKGNDLAAAISRLMPYQMGDSYLIEEQSSHPQQYSSAPSAQQVSGYSSAAFSPSESPWSLPEDSDLPF